MPALDYIFRRRAVNRLIFKQNLSLGRLQKSGNGLEQSGFAGAVTSDDAHYLPFFHPQGKIENDLDVPIADVYPINLQK